MKKVYTVLLACLICLASCSAPTAPEKASSGIDSYMGTWQIYTNSEADGGAIGSVTFEKTGEDSISVAFADFTGGVDITGVKNAKFTEDSVAYGVETVKDDEREIVLHFNLTKDAAGKESVVIYFIEPDSEYSFALESLYLFR